MEKREYVIDWGARDRGNKQGYFDCLRRMIKDLRDLRIEAVEITLDRYDCRPLDLRRSPDGITKRLNVDWPEVVERRARQAAGSGEKPKFDEVHCPPVEETKEPTYPIRKPKKGK